MPVKRFRTRPVEIYAMRFEGDNFDELWNWTNGNFLEIHEDDRPHTEDPDATGQVFDKLHSTWILVLPGQWIVRGAKGEFYPCDDETFHWKYEEVLPHGKPALNWGEGGHPIASKPGCMTQMRNNG